MAGVGPGPTLAQAGEFAVIAQLRTHLPPGRWTVLGPGDDAALVGVADTGVLVSTDLLVEGEHFRWDYSSPEDVGAKAAAVNFADIAAMGGRPTALLVGVAAPGGFAVSDLERLADGLREECTRAGGVGVVGGDTCRHDAGLVLAVTALGVLEGRAPVTRGGARPGDRLVLAGRTGEAAAGLALLRRGERGGELVEAQRRPRPPYAAGPQLARLGARAMIDVSDGLLADAGHLAAASGVRLVLDAAALPCSAELREAARVCGVEVTDWLLAGGEDHALLAAVPEEALAGALAAGYRQVGQVYPTASDPHELAELVDILGAPRPAVAGYDHFRARTAPEGQR